MLIKLVILSLVVAHGYGGAVNGVEKEEEKEEKEEKTIMVYHLNKDLPLTETICNSCPLKSCLLYMGEVRLSNSFTVCFR